jgi:membrane protein implicated in regulation of membrane protease activity
LISVAIGLGLAVAYYEASLRFQLLISKRSNTLVSALTAAGFLVRLTVFAVILAVLALFTELNIIATGVAFVVLFTVLSGLGMRRYISKAKRDRSSRGTGPEGGTVGG